MPRNWLLRDVVPWSLVALLAIALAVNFLAADDAELPATEPPLPQQLTTFETLCDQREKKDRERLRACTQLFREGFKGVAEKPDAVMFLWSRVRDLINATVRNADRAKRYHESIIWIVFVLALFAAFAAYLGRKDSADSPEPLKNRLAGTLLYIAALVVALSSALNWHLRYKAEFGAHQALVALRDTIEVVAIDAAVNGRAISGESLKEWLKAYNALMVAHAGAYTDAFKLIQIPN